MRIKQVCNWSLFEFVFRSSNLSYLNFVV